MIFHICHPLNDWPPDAFFKSWGKPIANRFRTLHFSQLGRLSRVPSGVYLFTDLEFCSPSQLDLLHRVWKRLEAHPELALPQNDPSKFVPRYDFLGALSERGVNDFRAFRICEIARDLRFPVFLRMASDHNGPRSPLLQSWDELEEEIAKAALSGLVPEQMLVVEYLETADERGLYRKYSYFKIGESVIPRHLFFSRNWVNKDPDVAGPEQIEEEREFLESNPHEIEVREHFELAQIDYGRIDYSFKNGRMQVWEINTNPIITLAPNKYSAQHRPNHEIFGLLALEAFENLDCIESEQTIPIDLRWPIQTTNHKPQSTKENGGGGEN